MPGGIKKDKHHNEFLFSIPQLIANADEIKSFIIILEKENDGSITITDYEAYLNKFPSAYYSQYCIDAIGWLAIALVIFTVWKPNLAIIGSIIFGALYIASTYIEGFSTATKEIFKMLPYIVTVIVLLFTSIRDKKKNQPPASLGVNYFREDR